jgi:hypothetical protein
MTTDANRPLEPLIADYLRGPEKVATLVSPLAEALLNFRPAPDRWSIHEILLHLVDFELVTAVRMRKILAEERPALPPFDQNAWASRLHYLDRQWRRSMQDLRRLREGNVEILGHLSEAEWSREGVHPERGPITLRQVIERAIEHLDQHARQMQENQRLFEQQARGVAQA